jgi:hypothetical protein
VTENGAAGRIAYIRLECAVSVTDAQHWKSVAGDFDKMAQAARDEGDEDGHARYMLAADDARDAADSLFAFADTTEWLAAQHASTREEKTR